MGFWPWIALRIFGRCVRAKSLRRDIGCRVPTLWRGLRVNTVEVEDTESTDKQKRKTQKKLGKKRLPVEKGARKPRPRPARRAPPWWVTRLFFLSVPRRKPQR